MHKQIKGELPNGEPYHSLEPEAYALVHATLADSIVRSHLRFVGPVELHQMARGIGLGVWSAIERFHEIAKSRSHEAAD